LTARRIARCSIWPVRRETPRGFVPIGSDARANRARGSALALGIALLVGCSNAGDNPLVEGLTPEQEAQLIEESIAQIERTENFTPDDFERLQRAHLETMSDEMRDAALEGLPKRVDKISILEMSQTLELDRDTASIDARTTEDGRVFAIVSIEGSRSFRTRNASKTIPTRFSLPWVISVERGKLAFRHRGIRMSDVPDELLERDQPSESSPTPSNAAVPGSGTTR
jgi:hypothetical protein